MNIDETFKVYQREWYKKTKEEDNGLPCFTVVSYNILGDWAVQQLFDQYASYASKENVVMTTRLPRILKELKEMDADIVCLQEVEVDHFHDSILPVMQALGYEGVHLHPEIDLGVATLYKKDKFLLLEAKHHILHHLAETALQTIRMTSDLRNSVRSHIKQFYPLLLTKFQHKSSGQIITAGNIHITWGQLKKQGIQLLQMSSTLKELTSFAGGAHQPFFLAGDCNSLPESAVYSMVQNGTPDLEKINEIREKEEPVVTSSGQKISLIDIIEPLLHHPATVKSAYREVFGAEPPITSCDDTDCGLWHACLDYVWVNKNTFRILGALKTPNPEDILKHHALPSYLFPSDHIPLKVQVAFDKQAVKS